MRAGLAGIQSDQIRAAIRYPRSSSSTAVSQSHPSRSPAAVSASTQCGGGTSTVGSGPDPTAGPAHLVRPEHLDQGRTHLVGRHAAIFSWSWRRSVAAPPAGAGSRARTRRRGSAGRRPWPPSTSPSTGRPSSSRPEREHVLRLRAGHAGRHELDRAAREAEVEHPHGVAPARVQMHRRTGLHHRQAKSVRLSSPAAAGGV